MVNYEWVLTEGVVDPENESMSIAAHADDIGIEIAYMACGILNSVRIAGVFDVCPMVATGFTQEQVQAELQPGYVAVPVTVNNKNIVLVISPDYDLQMFNAGVLPAGIEIDGVKTFEDLEDVSEDVLSILNIM